MAADQRYRSVLLFGPPGVGKGTQGGILANIPGFFHLAVGDVFRAIDIGSANGKEVYDYISRGELVPDELTFQIWKTAVDAYIALSRYKPREDLMVLENSQRYGIPPTTWVYFMTGMVLSTSYLGFQFPIEPTHATCNGRFFRSIRCPLSKSIPI